MEFDQKTAKLVTLFATINFVAALLGFAAVILFGVITGLIVFTLTVFLLPILVQYRYLSKETEKQE